MTAAIDEGRIYGKGISFPPRVGPDGTIVWSAGELNVRECICTILRTRPGERVELPAFGCGLDRYLYEPNNVATLRLIRARKSLCIFSTLCGLMTFVRNCQFSQM